MRAMREVIQRVSRPGPLRVSQRNGLGGVASLTSAELLACLVRVAGITLSVARKVGHRESGIEVMTGIAFRG